MFHAGFYAEVRHVGGGSSAFLFGIFFLTVRKPTQLA
jgi:hypothetical protein